MKNLNSDNAERIAAGAVLLLTPEAVRRRAHHFLDLARKNTLANFTIDENLLPAASAHVIRLLNARFPDRKVPFHARWRHFLVQGVDRADILFGTIKDRHEKARARFELAITSVLLDAGAGGKWFYRDSTGQQFTRSEGLAIASLDMFANGFFSALENPLQADAEILQELTAANLAAAFQVTSENPMAGLDGRAALLSSLGKQVLAAPDYFPGKTTRPGNLYDHLLSKSVDNQLAAREILISLLHALGPIWPDRLTLDGISLGDTWLHKQANSDGLPDGYIPFHKLSQWLAYSLIEPLHEAGITVTDVDGLTGLAEYRNGGLFIDYGIIQPSHKDILTDIHEPGSDVIVEWRALTVALLDKLAEMVRTDLGLDACALPLASVLEAGSWAAGREIAKEKREDGASPIAIAADGTVF